MPEAHGVILYTQRPGPGKVAGRPVDAELWRKVSPALACGPFDEATMEDAEVPARIVVRDARLSRNAKTLETDGFELVRAPIDRSLDAWTASGENRDALKAAVRSECEALALERLGCVEAVGFDVTFRSSARDNRDSSVGGPSSLSSAVSRPYAEPPEIYPRPFSYYEAH